MFIGMFAAVNWPRLSALSLSKIICLPFLVMEKPVESLYLDGL